MDYLVNIEQFSKYQYITGFRVAFYDTWHNNSQSGKAMTKS